MVTDIRFINVPSGTEKFHQSKMRLKRQKYLLFHKNCTNHLFYNLITVSNLIENVVIDKNNLQQNRWLKRYVIKDAFLLSHAIKGMLQTK